VYISTAFPHDRGNQIYIVDSQIHIWGADTPERPWPYSLPAHRPVPFSKEDALLELHDAGVQRAIIVPPWWEGERNDLALDATSSHPERFAAMGLFDADAPSARENLAGWLKQPGMLGFRFSSVDPKYRTALADGRIDWLWGEAERACIPIMMSVDPNQLHAVDRIAERHPALKITIDHLARQFGKKDAEAFPNMEGLLALAKWPNVAVKASGMPAYTTDGYPYHSAQPIIRRAYDAFGPRRMFWGSDLTKLPCTYRQAVTMFTEEIPWFSTEDKEWIMGRGLCEWLGWKSALSEMGAGITPE
jgi:L-fuconolactonase